MQYMPAVTKIDVYGGTSLNFQIVDKLCLFFSPFRRYYTYLQQAQAFYTFPFHQMMTATPMTAAANMEMTTEQPTLEGIPEPNIAQEPPKGSLAELC